MKRVRRKVGSSEGVGLLVIPHSMVHITTDEKNGGWFQCVHGLFIQFYTVEEDTLFKMSSF